MERLMKQHMTDKRTGISYTLKGEQYYPDLALPEQTDYPIGKYGQMHLAFIKKHRRGTYTTLLSELRLNAYLYEVDREARSIVENMTYEIAKSRGIDESLKARDGFLWAQEMNNCKAAAEKAVLKEIIFS